jgi:predicted nucleotidyltransferase
MRVVGVIAEYNPLHNGHIYHLEQAKRKTGASYCIVVMSGNFVQRGEPACTDKFTRAEWALQAGADLVIELPTVFANASAERFAEGAVRLLHATGLVTDLAFGAEQGDIAKLSQLADYLAEEPPEFKSYLQYHLKMGESFPRARYEALQDMGADPEFLSELVKPNNILAMEYLRSLHRYAPEICPVPIERIGGGYNDDFLTGEYSSATAIRAAIREGNTQVLSTMPLFVSGAMQFDPQFPLTVNDVGDMMLYKLRLMRAEEVQHLPDVREGFEQNLLKAARTAVDGESFFEMVKTKRYTMARVKRIGMSALLDVSEELVEDMSTDDRNLYFRVLGMRRDARSLLSAMASISKTPLIMRNADIVKCTDVARVSLRVDALSTDILSYALRKPLHRDSEAAILV